MKSKQALFARRARRRRFKLKQQSGNGRLRLSVFRSNRQTYAQIVDDRRGMTLVSASTLEKDGAGKTQAPSAKSVAAAGEVGRRLAERAKEKGVSTVVFDCGGYRYHGRVKALAEAAREAGMNF